MECLEKFVLMHGAGTTLKLLRYWLYRVDSGLGMLQGSLGGFGGDFVVPSYRGSSFLDPKV